MRRVRRRRTRRRPTRAAAVILLAVLTAIGYRTAVFWHQQRVEQQLAIARPWPVQRVELARPLDARLTTRHVDGFLHYTLILTSADGDAAALREAVGAVTFAARMIDADGYTVMTLRPAEPLTADLSGGTLVFRVDDIVGCSSPAYASTTSWKVDWQGI
jgi:hypothetical protein